MSDAYHSQLIRASRNGSVNGCNMLIDEGFPLEHTSSDGSTAIIWAARNGHGSCVEVSRRMLVGRSTHVWH